MSWGGGGAVHLSEPRFPPLPRGDLMGEDLSLHGGTQLCPCLSSSLCPEGVVWPGPHGAEPSDGSPRKLGAGERELASPLASFPGQLRCFLRERPPQEAAVLLGSWGAQNTQVRGLEGSQSSQSRREIPPLPPKRTPQHPPLPDLPAAQAILPGGVQSPIPSTD